MKTIVDKHVKRKAQISVLKQHEIYHQTPLQLCKKWFSFQFRSLIDLQAL